MTQPEEARLAPAQNNDVDAEETAEWLDALEAVIAHEGPERAHFLLEALIEKSRRSGAYIPFSPYTAYVNTIPPHAEARSPGDPAIEWRIRSIIRWNAMAMVAQANRDCEGIGGHIAEDRGIHAGANEDTHERHGLGDVLNGDPGACLA
jgi:pyruvate dehydrogenase complex dehydrogenase (E1) component